MISDEEIIKLWRDPQFSGSYRGARTFQVLLKTDLNIDVPLSRIYKVFNTDQIYLIHQRAVKSFNRRHYIVHNYGELVQMDIAQMFEHNGFKYFLLLVDVFSSKLFVELLKTRETNEILKAFKNVQASFKSQIYVIQADRESAFLSKTFKQYLHNQSIVFRPKFGKNKAAIG